MKKLIRILAEVSLILPMFFALVMAMDVEYVGSISDGLFAPTSIDVSDDQVAVLEPFSRQITTYTAVGILRQKIDIDGEASGLARLSEYEYLFCDRSDRTVNSINLLDGRQFIFLQNEGMFRPVDIINGIDRIYILDAGNGKILISNSIGTVEGSLDLVNSDGDRIGFASSFTLDRERGIFYVFDQLSSNIWMIGADGQFLGDFCSFGGSDGEVTRGGEIARDPNGNIFVTDRFQGLVAVFSPDGEFIGNINLSDFDLSSLSLPSGLAVDNQGFVYISTTENRRIEIIYVNISGAPSQALTALQAYPADDDTLDVDNVRLVSYIEDDSGFLTISGFDFQLFSDNDLELPLTEMINLAPSEEPNDSLGASVFAEWVVETDLEKNSAYNWRVRARNGETVGEWTQMKKFYVQSLPKSFSLSQNYPNPFNPSTYISFEIPKETDASITIFNSLGQVVRTIYRQGLPAGRHEIIWNGRDDDGNVLASGIYFYRLTAGDFSKTRKMVMIK